MAALLGVLSGVSCDREAAGTREPGAPLPDLTTAQLTRFQAGRALFERVYLPQEGLGPLFNENQCSACHTDPASGGTTGFERVVRATRYDPVRGCDLLRSDGGENIRSQATPALQAHGVERAPLPPHATEVGRFTPTFLFGLGLIEAIEDGTILSREDAEDADGDGISGRAGRTADARVARFGRKADFATIREFSESALLLEMGLTSPAQPHEAAMHGAELPPGVDPAGDPEVAEATVDLLTSFVRLLAPLSPAPPRSAAHGDTLDAGRRLFHESGCADCHTPTMQTGRSEIAALDRKTLWLYSDLLLHDMGPELSNVCARGASPRELRTTSLMGLGHRQFFLHDGRTSDLAEAVLAHGGEAERARDAFAALSWLRQYYLLAFLRSL